MTQTSHYASRDDEFYMRRCLYLAAQGLGRVRPNPMVGCVVVREGKVLAEGYHQVYGQWHAERNAILRAQAAGIDLHGATLYVNLEPCSHYGKTPPCADLVAASGVARVVCCNDDPNPLVAGRGFERLEAAGIEVMRHVLEAEGRWLNRRFFTAMEEQRPYVILKWAQSADGYMAPATATPYWISSPEQNRRNHQWRTEEAAILVGSGTYVADLPTLTARHYLGPQPQPIVADRRGRIADLPAHWLRLQSASPAEMLAEMLERKIQSVIVEGGRQMLDAFIASDLYDEVRILRGTADIGAGLAAPTAYDTARLSENLRDNPKYRSTTD